MNYTNVILCKASQRCYAERKHTSFPLVSVSFPKPHMNHRPRLCLLNDCCLDPDQISPGCEKTDRQTVLVVF